MSTASEEILARYKQTETETDAFGRVITLGRMRPAYELQVFRWLGSDDRTNQVTFLAVASVRSIDANTYPPARQLGDLEAMINMLDAEGLTAVGNAYARLNAPKKTEDGKELDAAAVKDDLKNA